MAAGLILKVPSLLHEAVSSVLGVGEAYAGGNLELKEGPGASSIEKGYDLFMPTICTASYKFTIA